MHKHFGQSYPFTSHTNQFEESFLGLGSNSLAFLALNVQVLSAFSFSFRLCIFYELLGLDNHVRWLEPNDLNLERMAVRHLDCVSRLRKKNNLYLRIKSFNMCSGYYFSMLSSERFLSVFDSFITCNF